MLDEFKQFVQSKPSLIGHVNNGTMSWQKFYDMWKLYGENHNAWNDYVPATVVTASSFSLGQLFNIIKGVDLNTVQKGISGLQNAVGLLQDLVVKDKTDTKTPYEPRPIHKKFED